MKIVASMTTMPNRIDLIRITLDSLRNQSVPISHIEINIPYKCIRTGQDYVIPEWLEAYPNLQIYRTEDYGAITKIAPTLIRYKDDVETYLWSVDDDINYPLNILACLMRRHDRSIKRILSHTSLNISSTGAPFHGVETDKYGMILEGFGTVLYPPLSTGDDFLSYLETTSAIPDCKVSDDIVLSNYFYGRKIPIFTCRQSPQEKIHIGNACLPYYKDATATHLQSGGHTHRYVNVLYKLKELGLLYWTCPLPLPRNNAIKKTSPPQRQPTRHMPFLPPTLFRSNRQAVHMPLIPPAVISPRPAPVKLSNNFALTGSSAKAGKRFYG